MMDPYDYSGDGWQTVLLDEGINPDDGSLCEYSSDSWQTVLLDEGINPDDGSLCDYSGDGWQTVLLDEGINADDGSLCDYSGDSWWTVLLDEGINPGGCLCIVTASRLHSSVCWGINVVNSCVNIVVTAGNSAVHLMRKTAVLWMRKNPWWVPHSCVTRVVTAGNSAVWWGRNPGGSQSKLWWQQTILFLDEVNLVDCDPCGSVGDSRWQCCWMNSKFGRSLCRWWRQQTTVLLGEE